MFLIRGKLCEKLCIKANAEHSVSLQQTLQTLKGTFPSDENLLMLPKLLSTYLHFKKKNNNFSWRASAKDANLTRVTWNCHRLLPGTQANIVALEGLYLPNHGRFFDSERKSFPGFCSGRDGSQQGFSEAVLAVLMMPFSL